MSTIRRHLYGNCPSQARLYRQIGAICLMGMASYATGNKGLEARPSAKTGWASWYSSADACPHNPDPRCPMANGRSLYDQEQHAPSFAASWDYPLGTQLLVTRLSQSSSFETVRPLQVEVTDRGPAKRLYRQGRILDLSQAAFHAVCGALSQGTCQVTVEAVR